MAHALRIFPSFFLSFYIFNDSANVFRKPRLKITLPSYHDQSRKKCFGIHTTKQASERQFFTFHFGFNESFLYRHYLKQHF